MDDAYTSFDPDIMKRAKQIARNAVDELGPRDLASVVFTFQGRAQSFTSDRSQLLRAIDSYAPKVTGGMGPPAVCQPIHRSCDVDTLSLVASTLLAAPPGRKIVILVSGGRTFTFGAIGDPAARNEATELIELFRDLQRANVTVYAFDARGLLPSGSMTAEKGTAPVASHSGDRVVTVGLLNESLYSFTESTGGRAWANMNNPEAHVSEAFGESSSYYFIGFRAASEGTGKDFRKVDVNVKRPGLYVSTRNGYFSSGTKKRPTEIVTGLPSGDLRIYAAASAVAVPDRREAEVILAARIYPTSRDPGPTTVELTAMAVDLEGKTHGTQRQTMTITPSANAAADPDLPAHLPLRPGRYMIRVAASSEGKSGSVFVDVEVPDFAKELLSASALTLQRHPAAPITDKVVAELVPVMPSTHRQFLASDDVGVFVRVYQGGKGRIVPVQVSAKVRDEKNSVRSTQEAMLEPADFSTARSADYRVSLPLAHLSPGAYLFEFDAQSGTRRVRRTARFSVAPSR
jgi:VWFA-related protein